MRNRFRNSKGFAMAELLAVCMVIMLLFSILFSNYLPILSEYENRLDYNNVTAEYAGHYFRKLYKSSFDTTGGVSNKLSVLLGTASYKQLYQKESENNLLCAELPTDFQKQKCLNLIEHYGIKEVILTKYTITGTKSAYTRSSGDLYNYINYLPEYKNPATVDGNQKELYRFIIKTDDFGYSTTAIDANYITPNDCFIGRVEGNDIVVTGYNFGAAGCGDGNTIYLPNGSNLVKIKQENSTSSYTSQGYIRAIGVNKTNPSDSHNFKGNTNIENIVYDTNGTLMIQDNAFQGCTNLKRFASDGKSDGYFAGNVSVGKYAFSNTGLKEVTLVGGSGVDYHDYAFSNNSKLEIVNLFYASGATKGKYLFADSKVDIASGIVVNYDGRSDSSITHVDNTIPYGIFKGSYLNFESLYFYKNVTGGINDVAAINEIKDQAYQNVTIKFGSSGSESSSSELENYEENNDDALTEDELENGGEDEPGTNTGESDEEEQQSLKQVVFPSTVETIGSDAFNGTELDRIEFSVGLDSEKSAIQNIYSGAFQNTKSDKSKELTIPDTINQLTIQGKVFDNAGISKLSFGADSYSKIVIDGQLAFANNDISRINLTNRFCPSDGSGVLTVGANMFYKNGKALNLSSANPTHIWPECAKEIPNKYLNNANIVGELYLPYSITSVGSQAFSNNPNMTAVLCSEVAAPLKTIGSNAFNAGGSPGLKYVCIPSNVTSIGNNAFVSNPDLAKSKVESESNPLSGPIIDYSSSSGEDWCSAFTSSECTSDREGNIITIHYTDELGHSNTRYIKKIMNVED